MSGGATSAQLQITGVPPYTEPLVTDFTARVITPVKEVGIGSGDTIVITVHGGHDAYGSGTEMGSPLPRIGDDEVVFLVRNQLDASKFTFINPQGRFQVTSAGTVDALDTTNPVGKKYDHATVGQLESAVQAADRP